MSRRWNGNQYTRRYLRRYERQAFNRLWRDWTKPKKTAQAQQQEKPEERDQSGFYAKFFGILAGIGLVLLVLNEIAPILALAATLVLIFIIATY